MAAAVARAPRLRGQTALKSQQVTLNTTSNGSPAPVPNKHIPLTSPGPVPSAGLETPPASPPGKYNGFPRTALWPPQDHATSLPSAEPPVYGITARKTASALEEQANMPLPDALEVFPWLHGIHEDNKAQSSFFSNRRTVSRKTPKGLRAITVVKAGGDLNSSRIKGAISPEELLHPGCFSGNRGVFLEPDPREGFSVRNFQIQACKMAMVSDIIVYGDSKTSQSEVLDLARRISHAQRHYEVVTRAEIGTFNTFVMCDSYSEFERTHPNLVAVNSKGCLTGNVVDLCFWERHEMCAMSKASEISRNVYLGPTPDPSTPSSMADEMFDIYIESHDHVHVPDPKALKTLGLMLLEPGHHASLQVPFPASGSLTSSITPVEIDGIMATCKWIYDLANGNIAGACEVEDEDGDVDMQPRICKPQKILIHCSDGYTESSFLGLIYFMYAEGLAAHDAWVQLHRDKGRNFFAYASDLGVIKAIEARILQDSPKFHGNYLNVDEPKWLEKCDGSLPSRILPYMYLGNLQHANNGELLKELGIKRILSIGEKVDWENLQGYDPNDLLFINNVQDNGVDPLMDEFERCLKFIEQGKKDGHSTLVHCRVGVSRSATICIAEVMKELGLSFPRAYCFVRARRLNVIIQPHLRFTYELLKWEEQLQRDRAQPVHRELEWATIAREIALMNKPYSSRY